MKKTKILLLLLVISQTSDGALDFKSFVSLKNKALERMKKVWQELSFEQISLYLQQNYLDSLTESDSNYQHKSEIAIASKNQISKPEEAFLNIRRKKANVVLQQFLGQKLDPQLNIACALSGGGYRAMIAAAGWLEALEELRLLDAFLYISSLSGSTWYLGPWVFSAYKGGYQLPQPGDNLTPLSPSVFNQTILKKIESNHFNLLKKFDFDFNLSLFNQKILWPKYIFGQIISSVDFFGGVLAHFLLAHKGKERHMQKLSLQLPIALNGAIPWPIYTAIDAFDSGKVGAFNYNWVEFNPNEIRYLEEKENVTIPSWAFARPFIDGKSTNFAPEQSFGFLMGTFGSAYTGLTEEIFKNFFFTYITKAEKPTMMPKGLQLIDRIRKGELKKFLNDLIAFTMTEIYKFWWDTKGSYIMPIQERISPAIIANPFKGLKNVSSRLNQKDYLTLIDAGISYNVPILSLFKPERNIDIILVGDASANVVDLPEGDDSELVKGLSDIKRLYGIQYKKMVDEKTFKVYQPQNTYTEYPTKKAPLVLYINFMKDEELLKKIGQYEEFSSFDPRSCVTKGACNTFNFAYNAQEFRYLSGLAKTNLLANKDNLKSWISKRLSPAPSPPPVKKPKTLDALSNALERLHADLEILSNKLQE